MNSQTGYIEISWYASTHPHGIRAYLIKLTLKEIFGTAIPSLPEQEFMYYGFNQTAATIKYRLDLPLGYKYNVKVAAIDNSISQNISSYTDMGDIVVGSGSSLTMTNINLTPINGGVTVDWADVSGAIEYEVIYSLDKSTPSWQTSKIYVTTVSEYTILAEPGTTVKVRVRTVDGGRVRSTDISGEALAGGVVIGDNDKVLSLYNVSVAAADDGKTARELGKLRLPNNANIKEIAVNISGLSLNNSARGLVRIWRDNAESDAASITFSTSGATELELDVDMTPGWIVVDAYDTEKSGSNQAAFTADIHVTYSEGKVSSYATSGTTGKQL